MNDIHCMAVLQIRNILKHLCNYMSIRRLESLLKLQTAPLMTDLVILNKYLISKHLHIITPQAGVILNENKFDTKTRDTLFIIELVKSQ